MFIFLFIYVFFGSDFSLICVFTPFYVLFGTVSRLHAKSASLKWSICRSVLFKLMVTLICFCSLAIGDCASMFLKVYVSVFHYPLVKKSLVTMCLCMYFQDNLIFEDRIIWGCLWGGAALLILPHVLSFVLRLIDSFMHQFLCRCQSDTCILSLYLLLQHRYTGQSRSVLCMTMPEHPLPNMKVHESWWLTQYSNFFNKCVWP